MLRTRTSRIAAPAALLALLAVAPASADAARQSTFLYDVTVRATMKESWHHTETAEIGAPWDPCSVARKGEGSSTVQLRSRRPTRVMIMRGTGGRPPMLNVGTGEGVPLTGTSLRTGSDEEHHAGSCAAANPPNILPTDDCGRRSVEVDWNLAWKPGTRNVVYPSVIWSDPHDRCPSTPGDPVDWKDDQSPSLMDVVAQVGQNRFLGTKQFTVRGEKTFEGVVEPISKPHVTQSGAQKVTWQWETTYRLASSKKKRKRR